ncbi:MAG: glycoside hydrolase family 2 protein, partial [Bacilli bacterium]|nr:glycoside hydrolase family 2 protein [Bacilli bacterium]
MKMKINWNKEWNIFYNGKFWDKADLPLDLMIRSPRNKDSSAGGSNAYFEGAVYAFEKELVVPAEWLTKKVYLRFDGVYRNAEVFVNGESLCRHAYGYTGFDVCLDGHIQEGSNLIRVVADNSKTPNSRWYTGGGIYRDVTLIIQEPVCFELDSVRVETMSINPPKIHVKS